MELPDVRTLKLAPNVMPEWTGEPSRLVLWARGTPSGRFVTWQRIVNQARGAITIVGEIAYTPASVISLRQRVGGVLSRSRRARRRSEQEFVLPTGDVAESIGERRTDVVLAWSLRPSETPIVAQSRLIWPMCRDVIVLSENLVLVDGVARVEALLPSSTTDRHLPLRETAERMLSVARRAGDRQGQVVALTDLGILLTEQGEARAAISALEEALALSRELSNRSAEADVLANLGLPVLAEHQPERALALFLEAASTAREAGNTLVEKVTLERLGLAYAAMEQPQRALEYFERALELARRVGDRVHQATLCWNLAVQSAELGERDRAVAEAERAIDLLNAVGKPEAATYAEHLARYRQHGAERNAGSLIPRELVIGGTISTSSAALRSAPCASASHDGPGLLRMAVTAAKAFAKLACTRFKTVPANVHAERTRICAACDDRAGLRCLVCGCFTDAKARLPHEDCPRRKWPIFIPVAEVAGTASARTEVGGSVV